MEFGVFRKPTQTDLVIPKESNHPFSYKLAAFRSMANRLLGYKLSAEEYALERDTMNQIAICNGYDPSLIDNLIRKTKFKLAKPRPTENKKDSNFIPMGYTNKNTELIGNIFKREFFYPGYKINKRMSFNSRNKVENKETQKGVYIIECDLEKGCNQKYIGYTNRSFKERFKEHNARNHKCPASMVAQHLKANPSHNINFKDSMKVLKTCGNKAKSKVYEEYFIYKHISDNGKTSLLNKKDDFSEKITYKLYAGLDSKQQSAASR